MGSTVPAGYLICNGTAVSRTAYDKLFQAIGTKYGEGDGSTTFNLPNLIDRFLQGSETSGTVKDAGLPNITGTGIWGVNWIPSLFSGALYTGRQGDRGTGYQPMAQGVANLDSTNFDASRSNSIYGNSSTVQPPSITSIPCIKAFDSVIDATTVSVAQLSDTKVNKAGDTMTGSLTAPSFIANGIDCSVDSQGDGYIRYSNGLQICWGAVENNNSLGTGVTRHSFPMTFSAAPILVAAPVGPAFIASYTVMLQPENGTTFIINSYENFSPPSELTPNPLPTYYIAIGKWK